MLSDFAFSTFCAPEHWVGEDFVVRCYRPGDGPALAEATNASYEHLKTFMDWVLPHTSTEDAEMRARRNRAKYLVNEDFTLAIFNPAQNRLLGGCGYHLRGGPLENQQAEIGMWIRADAAHKGLGTRVLCALLEWGFSEWPFLRLAWHCSGRNLASRRTAEKAGMVLDGILRSHGFDPGRLRRDEAIYSALRGEWGRGA